MYLAVAGQLAWLIAVSDPIKATRAEVLAGLKALGIGTVMATGDGLTTAKTVAEKLGVDKVDGRSSQRTSSIWSRSCSEKAG